jgi:hypothetical protein
MRLSSAILIVYCISFFSCDVVAQELLLPLGKRFKQKYYMTSDGDGLTSNGVFPATEGQFGEIYAHQTDTSYLEKRWLNRKLFNEHLAEIRGENYYFAFDPLMNLHVGKTAESDSINLFQNTRAFQVHGEVMGKVAFYTSFFENQARFADFQTTYFEDRGEQRYSESKGYYDTINATIPGGGRTKPFKEGAFDYASAIAYMRYRLADFLAIQLGNHPHFVGWGHRSLLLSDNSFNFTQIKMDWQLGDKWSYTTMHGKQLNLFRRIRNLGDTTFVTAVEEPYEKKNFSVKYLSFKPIPQLSIGLFEAQVYFREDSIQSKWMHPLYFNPLPIVNTGVFGWENDDAKSILGLNFAWNFWKTKVFYGQFVMDEIGSAPQWGGQIGIKANKPFGVKGLFIQGEVNTATSQLYAANNRRLAYTHFNLPLAHSLGNGFSELVAKAHYSLNHLYLDFHIVYYKANRSIHNMQALFNTRGEYEKERTTVLMLETELGYSFNSRTRLSVFLKGVYRSERIVSVENATNLFFVGLKTNVFNRYFDF